MLSAKKYRKTRITPVYGASRFQYIFVFADTKKCQRISDHLKHTKNSRLANDVYQLAEPVEVICNSVLFTLGHNFTFSESVNFSESNGKAFMAVSYSGPKLQATAQRVEVFEQ